MLTLTQATQAYINTFHSYISVFLHWGQWLFISLAIINIAWMCAWYAFDKSSLIDGLSSFLKKFFMISFFYTVMLHPEWLFDLLSTANVMGNTLTRLPIDPSSLISMGIGIGNKIILPLAKSSILTSPFGVILGLIVYVIIMFVFISIAIDLALTLIMTTALIAAASFLLGFAALGSTMQIARKTLDVILAQCVKLLGIYLVVAAGSKTIKIAAAAIPTSLIAFDPYAWIVAIVFLFWLLAKNLPSQLARLVSHTAHENRGTDLGTVASSAARAASTVGPGTLKAGAGVGKILGSTAYNAAKHFANATVASGHPELGMAAALGGSAFHLGKATLGNLTDRFKDIASKAAGGPGTQQPIQSISDRMYQSTRNINIKTD